LAIATQAAGAVTYDTSHGQKNWTPWTLLAAVDPTTSYAAAGTSSHFKTAGADSITLLFTRAHSSATSIEWYVEWSLDGTTFFRTVTKTVSGGTVTNAFSEDTITAGATILRWTDSFPAQAPYCRVVCKRTGGAAGDTVAIVALVCNP